jgi:hypothetical protein
MFSRSYNHYWLFSGVFEIVIQENSKIKNFEYDVIWKTPIRTKWYQFQLSSLQLAKVIATLKNEIAWGTQFFFVLQAIENDLP